MFVGFIHILYPFVNFIFIPFIFNDLQKLRLFFLFFICFLKKFKRTFAAINFKPSQMKTPKHYVLSFVTFDGIVKFYANGNGELNNGEQTKKIEMAAKFASRKEAIRVDAILDSYYFVSTVLEPMPGIYIF